jgi:hypothetical protein
MFVGYRKSFEPYKISLLNFGFNVSNISLWSQFNNRVSSSSKYNYLSMIKIIDHMDYDHSENNR